MNKKQWIIFSIILLSIIALMLWRIITSQQDKLQLAPLVTVDKVIQKNVLVTLQTIGTVEAFAFVNVKSMVTGPLLKTGFVEGDIVQKGQVLFEIDPRPFKAALSQAEADLARNQATLTNNQLQVKRNEQLLKKGYVAKQDFDTLVANAKTAQASSEASEATVANAKLQLEYATIRAPITGKTGNILLKTGSIIKANDTDPLVTIRQINPIYVSFALPQDKFALLNTDQMQPIMVKALINNRLIEIGKLSFIDNSVDTATGNIQMKATFENKNHKLWPGQYVTVEFPIREIKNAILVPSLAVLTGQKGFYVYVVDDKQTAHIRFVTPGNVIGDQTIIKKGLRANEIVITSGQLRVKDKERVVVNAS